MTGEGQQARHVAIIMDGNGRWAKRKHLPRAMGHRKGVEAVRELVRSLKDDEKKKEISEDERKRSEDEVQKLTDKYVGEADQAAQAKEKEILTQ